jgi:hypothetical protein
LFPGYAELVQGLMDHLQANPMQWSYASRAVIDPRRIMPFGQKKRGSASGAHYAYLTQDERQRRMLLQWPGLNPSFPCIGPYHASLTTTNLVFVALARLKAVCSCHANQ